MRPDEKPNLDDALTDLEIKKTKAAAFENSNWGKFLNAAVTWAGDAGKGFSDAWSPVGNAIGKTYNAAVNKFGQENINKVAAGAGSLLGGGLTPALNRAQDVIELESKSRYNADIALREQQQQQLNFLLQSDPASVLIPKLEEALSKPVAEPITGPAGTLTFLDQKVYDPWFENLATGLLAVNPDVIKKAREENAGIWSTAREYANEVSFGQAGFDLAAGLGGDNVFNIDITDQEQRNWLFYEGDGLVGEIGKTTSGAIDLTKQLVLDPMWVAGKGAKLARLATLDVATVREATGINKLWQQSYFVDGEEALVKYSNEQNLYSATKDEITKLEQQRLAANTEISLIDNQLANPTIETNTVDLLARKDTLKQQSAELTENIVQLEKSKPAVPTLAAGLDEFYNQILDGKLRAVELVGHSRLLRWGAMKNKMAEVYELAAKNGDIRDLIDIDLIAMGIDPQAATRLRARRASLLTIIEDQKIQLDEFKKSLQAMAGDNEAAKQLIDESYASAKNLFEAYKNEDRFLAAAVASEEQRVASVVGQLDPRATSRFRSVEARRAEKARSTASVQFETYQNTSLARPVHLMKVTGDKLSGRYRPSNMVAIDGLDQADGVDELTAWFQLAGSRKVAGKLSAQGLLGKEFFEKQLNNFIVAPNGAAKSEILQNIERETLRRLIISAGIKIPEGKEGIQLLDDFLKQWINFKNKKVSLLREEGFYIDSAGNIVDAPLLKPELAYSYYMTDVRDMAKWISENKVAVEGFLANTRKLVSEGTLLREGWENVSEAINLMDQMWRFGVLARLGYPVRNVGTEWLKFSIIGGMMKVFSPYHSSLDQLPKALQKSATNWASNKYNFYKRTSLRIEAKRNSSWQVSIKGYPEYVNAQNDLRKADILNLIEDMDYKKFVILSNRMADDAALLADQPDFIQKAHTILQEIKDSQKNLATIMDRFDSYSKKKRNTGTVEIYGYEFEEAYAGTQGQYLKDALSSGPTIEMMSAGMKQAGSSSKWLNIDTYVYPDYPEYYPNLSNYIQNKVVNSPTALRVMEITNTDDAAVASAMRESLIKDLKTNFAYRDEIMNTKRYNNYKIQMANEKKEIKFKLIENGYLRSAKEEFKPSFMTQEEVDLLDVGILPERFGTSSPEYVKAAKVEAKRLADEYDMLDDPQFEERLSNLRSAIPLSKAQAKIAAEEGVIPYASVVEALKVTRLQPDEFSALISAGYIEAAGTGGHFSEALYQYISKQELRDMAFKYKGKLHIELPWAKQTKKSYIADQMAVFNEKYPDIRGEELLRQYLDEQIAWIDTHMPLDETLENMSASKLVKMGIGNLDNRTIEERYIDDIEELFTRYFPEPKLRNEILGLKAGQSITPAKLRYYLEDRGFTLSPITGDLLVDQTRKRALAFKKIRGTQEDAISKTEVGNLKREAEKASRLLDQGYLEATSRLKGWKTKTKVEKPSEEFSTLSPEEQVKAIEANKLLRAAEKDISISYMFKEFRSKVFKYIGQIPEDNLVRWPFGKTAYNNHIEQIAKQWYKAGFEPTQADLYGLHTAARAKAISESRKYLYTAVRKLNGVGNIPGVSPFYQAALTGTKNWGRITWNDPSILARRTWMFNYINHHADYDKKNGNRTLTINMPQWVIDSLPEDSAYKRALNVYPELKFDVSSFNLIFPGMRLGFEGGSDAKFGEDRVGYAIAGSALEAAASSIGVGPTVVMSVETLVKGNPNVTTGPAETILPARWIIDKIIPSENVTTDPFYWDSLPPAVKRVTALIKGVDAAEYARINAQIYMTYMHRMETGEMERMSLEDIESRVNEETAAVIVMKGITNLTLPAIPQFTGEVNTMIDLWREYQAEHKENAFQEFIDDYPDWWSVTATMSENPGGILSTTEAVAMAKKHGDLVNQVNGLVPGMSNKFLGMLINKENGSTEFDPASRVWMYENDYYKTLTPKEALNEAAISKGNYDYYKKRDERDLAIKNFGISIGNPDLSSRNTSNSKVREENEKFNNWLKGQINENPTWWVQEWEPKQGGVIQKPAIRAARMMLNDPKWMADQDPDGWTKQLDRYLKLQDIFAIQYAVATTSAEKERIVNSAALSFEGLTKQNETWAYYYDRYFDKGDGVPFLDKVGK